MSSPPAIGESTMRIVVPDSHSSTSRQSVVNAHPSPLPPSTKATEVRIVTPSSSSTAASRSLIDSTQDIWSSLSQHAAEKNGGAESASNNASITIRVPVPDQAASAISQKSNSDLFGRLFTSAAKAPQSPPSHASDVVASDVPAVAPTESTQPYTSAPAEEFPAGFAPTEGLTSDVPRVPATVERHDLFETWNTVVKLPSPAPAPVAPQSAAPAAPGPSTARIATIQPAAPDVFVRMFVGDTAKTSNTAQPEAVVVRTPEPATAGNAANAAAEPDTVAASSELVASPAPDLFGGLSDARLNYQPAPAPKRDDSPATVLPSDTYASLPPLVSQPVPSAPAAPPQPMKQPSGIVTDAPSITVPQPPATPSIVSAPAARPNRVQQPITLPQEMPAMPEPTLAIKQSPPASTPVTSPSVISPPVAAAPVAIKISQPQPAVEQFVDVAAERAVVQAPAAVRIATAHPAEVAQVPQQAPATPIMSLPEPVESIATSPITAAPVHTAPHTPAPPTEVAAAPASDRTPVDYRLVPVTDDAYRSVSRFAGMQQVKPTAESTNSFPLLPIETFTFADVKKPMTADESGATAHANTLPEPHPIVGGAGGPHSVPGSCPYLPGQSGAPYVCGVSCGAYGAPCCATWRDGSCIPWSLFGPGEYIGPARPEHVSTYYLRVNDIITLTFITSRRKEAERYRIGCGDRLRLEWLRSTGNAEGLLDREALVQPDGSISLPLIGEITAAGKTVKELQDELVKAFSHYQRDPQITVVPLEVNMAIQDIINAVTSVSGSNGQTQALRVTPEGTIQAPGLGSVYVQGLTLDELRSELEARYAATFGPGLLISPSLTERATMYVFVGGEVRSPSRYELQGPTTVMQAITLAGGWNVGGNLHQVVVFRRDENWCLKATKIDVRAPLYGNDPCPANDVWLRDNDLVVVPKSRILCATDVIQLYFTRGIYAAFPINYVYDFSASTGITPIP